MSIFDIDDNINVKIDRDVYSIDTFEKAMLTCVMPGSAKCVGAAPDFADRLLSTLEKAKLSLLPHKGRKVIPKDCRELKKGDALGWIRDISKDDKDAIVVLENVTRIPEGDPATYDPKQYVENILVRSWKNIDVYIDDYHIDTRNLTVILTCPPEDEEQLRAICSMCSYAWVGDIEKKIESKLAEKGIVLNRMYTGSYLSSNLGHEVINMFQADDDKHYLYLNAKGNFSPRGQNMGTMLLVRGIGDKQVEVVGMAMNLTPVESACCQLPRDLGRINKPVHDAQMLFIENVKYGGQPIKKIFGDEGQQSVFVSYVTDNKSFYKPKHRIIINFGTEDKDADVNLSINFASTSLHQFIEHNSSPQDWLQLDNLCKDPSLWELDNQKASVPDDFSEHQESLFDICRIQDDENKFSNALSYFIEKYPDIWINYFKEKYNIELSKIDSVTREEDAKVDEWKEVTGGRIDLLIRSDNYYIILENKIDSNVIKDEKTGKTQLERYYNYVKYLQIDENNRLVKKKDKLKKKKKELEGEIKKYNDWINDEKKLKYKLRSTWLDKLNDLTTEINKTEEDLKDLPVFEEREVVGFVLAPNYNPPTDDELEVKDSDGFKFKFISYKELYDWLQYNAEKTIDEDPNFKAFHNAMKKHTYATKSEAIREDMKNTFFARIQKCRKSRIDENA